MAVTHHAKLLNQLNLWEREREKRLQILCLKEILVFCFVEYVCAAPPLHCRKSQDEEERRKM
jgi:hypothetical protein